MKISDTIKRQMLLESEQALNADISRALLDAMMDPDLFADEDAVLEAIVPMIEILPAATKQRHLGMFSLWKSTPKEGNESHWMHDLCSSTPSHLIHPVEEVYGRSDMYDALQQYNFLDCVKAHIVLAHNPNVAAIVYNEVGTVEQHLHLAGFHPYYAAPTLHEFFRLLLEWQWANRYAGNNEHMALLACQMLDFYGLDVDRTSDPVVAYLMSLPNQQIFQYMNTGTVSYLDDEPLASNEFKIWCLKKGLVNGSHRRLDVVYESCLMLKSVKARLAAL